MQKNESELFKLLRVAMFNCLLNCCSLTNIYIHSMYKNAYWLCYCFVVSSLPLFFFYGAIIFFLYHARPKQTWNLWINAIIWFRRVFFFLQYMFSLHAPFIAWIFLYGSLCDFFSSSLSSVFVIWCNCTAWNAFNLFDLCALTCYIDVIAKSSNSSWNTRFVCVCVFLLLIFDP